MSEDRLPESIRRKASVSPEGEHAWRQADVEEAIEAARDTGLGCLGGQVQFRPPDGICEAYWLKCDPAERQPEESWQEYVSRSADETLEAYRQLCRTTDFRAVAREWEVLRASMDRDGYDPTTGLWFVLYFVSEEAG